MTITTETATKAVFGAIRQVAPDTDPETVEPTEDLWYALDLDSMDQLNVMVAVGAELGVVIPESDYAQFATMQTLIEYLVRTGTAE